MQGPTVPSLNEYSAVNDNGALALNSAVSICSQTEQWRNDYQRFRRLWSKKQAVCQTYTQEVVRQDKQAVWQIENLYDAHFKTSSRVLVGKPQNFWKQVIILI